MVSDVFCGINKMCLSSHVNSYQHFLLHHYLHFQHSHRCFHHLHSRSHQHSRLPRQHFQLPYRHLQLYLHYQYLYLYQRPSHCFQHCPHHCQTFQVFRLFSLFSLHQPSGQHSYLFGIVRSYFTVNSQISVLCSACIIHRFFIFCCIILRIAFTSALFLFFFQLNC